MDIGIRKAACQHRLALGSRSLRMAAEMVARIALGLYVGRLGNDGGARRHKSTLAARRNPIVIAHFPLPFILLARHLQCGEQAESDHPAKGKS